MYKIYILIPAKPAPLRNCTLRPYTSPSTITTLLNSSNLPPSYPFYASNQIANGGQHLKELNYITTEYVKDKNLLEDRKKGISLKQPTSNTYQQQHQYHQDSERQKGQGRRNYNKEKNTMGLSLNRQEHQQQQQFHNKNNTNNINFSDNKSSNNNNNNKKNDRYKSNFKSTKRHALITDDSSKEQNLLSNETKHVNFNKRNFTSTARKNQYSTAPATFSYLRSSSIDSKYQQPSPINSLSYNNHIANNNNINNINNNINNNNNNNNNNPYANNVHTETVEQPTLMELECIAGYDGGLPQYFFLEAYDSRTRKLRLNITSALNDIPLFRIDLAGTQFIIAVNFVHNY